MAALSPMPAAPVAGPASGPIIFYTCDFVLAVVEAEAAYRRSAGGQVDVAAHCGDNGKH